MNKILDNIEEWLVCICLAVMTLITFVNVIARWFSASLSFSEEITTYLFVLLSLLGAAIAAKRGAHLGLTLITDHVGRRSLTFLQPFRCSARSSFPASYAITAYS